MRALNLRKFPRLYLWVIILLLAVIVFILLKSPAAGQRQASQGPSHLAISTLQHAAPTSNDPGLAAGGAKKSETNQSNTGYASSEGQESYNDFLSAPPSTEDDGNLVPLPEVIPDPDLYPKRLFCPLNSEGTNPYRLRCPPCRPFPYVPLSESVVVCIDSESGSARF